MCSIHVILLLIISNIVRAENIVRRRGVSSRDWQRDEPEYEILDEPRPDWSCTFERHDCGIGNDQVVGQHFQLSSAQLSPSVAKRSMLLLNITQIPGNPSGARLITPYFQTKYYSKGCLTIDYMTTGDGIKDLLIYQQETQNRCLWKATASQTPGMKSSAEWQKLFLSVDLSHGDPRFFIEVHIDNRPPNTGLVAVSAISFFHNACKRNDANACGLRVRDEPNTEDSTSATDDDYLNDLP